MPPIINKETLVILDAIEDKQAFIQAACLALLEDVELDVDDHATTVLLLNIKCRYHLSCGKLPETIDTAKQILALDPFNAIANNYLGRTYLKQQKYSDALACFELAINSNDVDDENKVIALNAMAECYLKRGNTIKVKECLDIALQINPKNTRTLNTLARLHIKNENFDWATIAYDRTLAEDPTNLFALLGKSRILAKNGNVMEARKLLERVLSKDPECIDALYELGLSYLNDYEGRMQALTYFKRILELDPNHRKSEIGIARLHLRMRNYDKAKKTCEAILSKSPNDVEAKNMLKLSLLGKNDHTESDDSEKTNKDVNTKNMLALSCLMKSNIDEAERIFIEVLILAPNNPVAHFGMLFIDYQLLNFRDSKKHLGILIKRAQNGRQMLLPYAKMLRNYDQEKVKELVDSLPASALNKYKTVNESDFSNPRIVLNFFADNI